MEFKGTKRAEQYSKGAGTLQSYSDYLNGYNQALEDTKSKEMLDMLIYLLDSNRQLWGEYESRADQIDEVEDLINKIKQTT